MTISHSFSSSNCSVQLNRPYLFYSGGVRLIVCIRVNQLSSKIDGYQICLCSDAKDKTTEKM